MIQTNTDSLVLSSNVVVRLLADDGSVVDEKKSHNVFTNNGRLWLRNHLARALYPAYLGPEANCTDGTGADANSVVLTGGGQGRSYWPRWIGLGVGGVGQKVTPPGPGTYVEQVTVERLERPVQVTDVGYVQWLRQVLVQDDLLDTATFPTDYAIRYRAIFAKEDISFAGQPTYGTAVPISEAALFTSEAGIEEDPSGQNYNVGKIGMIAYNTFDTIVKTPKFALELSWELRV